MGNQLWARDVVLCVTGLTRQERQTAEEVITAAGGRYSPNLSRRCTHLLVAQNAPASDKLASAIRNQHKWGLKLVNSGWLAACAEWQALLDERPYMALADRTPLVARLLNKVASDACLATGTTLASRASVPESCGQPPTAQHHQPQQQQQQGQHQHRLRVEGAGPSQVWRPVPSNLHTQLAEVEHSLGPGSASLPGRGHAFAAAAHDHSTGGSVHLIAQGDSSGSSSRRGAGPDERQRLPRESAAPSRTKGTSKGGSKGVSWAPLPDAAAERFSGQPVELDSQGNEADWPFEHLPLTQAGFMPTDDLLHQLQGQDQSAFFSPLPRKPLEQPGSRLAGHEDAGKHGVMAADLVELEWETAAMVAAEHPVGPAGLRNSRDMQQQDSPIRNSANAGAPDSWVRPAIISSKKDQPVLQLAGMQQAAVLSTGMDKLPFEDPNAALCNMPPGRQQRQQSSALSGHAATMSSAVSTEPTSPAAPQNAGNIASLLSRLQQVQQAPAFTPLAARRSRQSSAMKQEPSSFAAQQQQPAQHLAQHPAQQASPSAGSGVQPSLPATTGRDAPAVWQQSAPNLETLVQQLQQATYMEAHSGLPWPPHAQAQPQLLAGQGQQHLQEVSMPHGQPLATAALVRQLRAAPAVDGNAAAALLGDAARAEHTAALLQQMQVTSMPWPPVQRQNQAPGLQHGSPMQASPAPALRHQQLTGLVRQRENHVQPLHDSILPAAPGSPMQVSPVPGARGTQKPQDILMLLQQLQGSIAMEQKQQRPGQPAVPEQQLPSVQPQEPPQLQTKHAKPQELAALLSLVASRLQDSKWNTGTTASLLQQLQSQGQELQQQRSCSRGGRQLESAPSHDIRSELSTAWLLELLQQASQRQHVTQQQAAEPAGAVAGSDGAAVLDILARGRAVHQGQQQPSGNPGNDLTDSRHGNMAALLGMVQQDQEHQQQQQLGHISDEDRGHQAVDIRAILSMLQQGEHQQQQRPGQGSDQEFSRQADGIQAILSMLQQEGQQQKERQVQGRNSNHREPGSRPINPGATISAVQQGQRQLQRQSAKPAEAGPDSKADIDLVALLQQLQQAGQQCPTGKASDRVPPPAGQQTWQGKAPAQPKQGTRAASSSHHQQQQEQEQQGMSPLSEIQANSQAQRLTAAKPQRPASSEEAALRSLEKGLAAAIMAAEEEQQQAADKQGPAQRSREPAAAHAMHAMNDVLPAGQVGMLAPSQQSQQPGVAAGAPAAPAAASASPVPCTAQAATDSPTVSEIVLATPSTGPPGSSQHQSCCQEQQQQPLGSQPGGGMPSPMQLDWQQAPHIARVAAEGQGGLAAAAGSSGGFPEPTLVVPELPGQSSCADAASAGSEGAPCRPHDPYATPGNSVGGGCDGCASAVPGSGLDAGSAARGREAASQVAESVEGVFEGIAAILDPDLPQEESHRVTQALGQGGGRVVVGARLGQGATHVVCQPEAALRWLSMGLGIISPQWVLRSFKAGRQQRCLMVSADATRHLPAGAEQGGSQLEESLRGTDSSRGSISPLGQLQSKEARAAMLQQLAGHPGGPSAAAGASLCAGERGALLCTPTSLLVGVSWSVIDPPARAVPDSTLNPRPASELRQYGPGDVIPDSEDDEEQFCFGATQGAYQEALDSLALSQAPGGSSPLSTHGTPSGANGISSGRGSGSAAQRTQQAWLQEATGFAGAASLTLLLPKDGRGELGHDSRCFALPDRAASPLELLQFIYNYYQEALAVEEQVELLRSSSAVHAVATLVKPAFLDMRPLARHQLLGPRLSLEGLFKVTREPLGSMYELRLGC